MFEKFREQLDGLVKRVSERDLKERDLDEHLNELELLLVQNDVAVETAERITENLREQLVGQRVSRWRGAEGVVRKGLKESLLDVLEKANSMNLEKIIKEKEHDEPFVMAFVGINGVGKSTTIAKIARLFKDKGYKVILACSDTYRAGAIEQLQIHSERLGLNMVKQPYGADPAAVAYDAIQHAKARGADLVLIDTAGRQHIDKNLMNELRKVIRVAEPDLVLFVVDSLTGNDGIRQAERFLEFTDFDGVIMTKMDADARGGIAVSIVDKTSRPIAYVGTGQEYEDLETFDRQEYVRSLVGDLPQ